MYTKYPNRTKLAFALRAEKEMLAKDEIVAIPYATRNYWRRQNPEKYLEIDQQIERHGTMTHTGHKIKYLRLLLSIRQLSEALINHVGVKEYHNILDAEKESFVNCIENNKTHFAKIKLLKAFKVSPSKYSIWLSQVRFDCTASRQYLCAKRHTQQLTGNEIDTLQYLLNIDKMKHWPLSAVWAHGIRNKRLMVSRSSFYRYNKIFKFRMKPTSMFRKKYIPLRANGVNQIWHADLTYVQTEDGKWNYIYAIIDNYSKMVLSYRVEGTIKAAHSTACISEALANEKIKQLDYITDGGKEYNNLSIKEFLKAYDVQVKHSVAKRDIKQSNSMIERLFHLIKKDYLNRQSIKNLSALKVIMHSVFKEYNNRPHYVHKYYTPIEAHKQNLNFNADRLLKQAGNDRMSLNKNCPCTVCTCQQQ